MSKKLTNEQILNRINQICADVDTSKVAVVDMATPVILICREHGEYLKTPSQLFYKNPLCPICSNIQKKKKLSDIGKTKTGKLNGFYGKHHTEQSKQKKKETCLEKYGYENSSSSPKIREKISNTVKSVECQEKIIATNLERYGVKNYTQTAEFKERYEITSIEHFGVTHPMKNDAISKKASETWSNKSEEEKQNKVRKVGDTKLERYGDSGYNNIEQIRRTNLEKYGKEHINLYGSDEFKNNLIDKYGENYQKQFKKKADNTKQQKSEEFEQENNCTAIGILIKKYGQGWLSIRDELTFLDNGQRRYVLNSDIPKIEEYAQTTHVCGYTSEKEKELLEYIKSIYSGEIIENDRKTITPKELDIYIPEKKIAIEFNGTYWHSNLNKERNYHFEKSKSCEERGIRLIHIYEWELEYPYWEKIQMMLNQALGNNPTIYARNCEIKEISNKEAKSLNEKVHLQGHRNAQVTYGLFYKDELVQLMSFSKTKYNKNLKTDSDWEIIRGCPGSNISVVGGVSKLFKHFVKIYNPSKVFSYCDFNKFDGKSYEKLGMNCIGYTSPDKIWIVDGFPVKRSPSKYKELKSKSEAIVWGSGSKKYVWEEKI